MRARTGRALDATVAQCLLCGRSSNLISAALSVCADCIRGRPSEALPRAAEAHARARAPFGLPPAEPKRPDGRACVLCARQCRIADGERGYCGLRTARAGRLIHLAGVPERGMLEWYRDPLPTNCVADWVCAGSRQLGFHNLAVFYESCTLDCLFCQNWHFRRARPERGDFLSAEELAAVANERTFCVCFFGGDPASQMPHALAAGRLLARRGVAVCWETAGTCNPKLLDQAIELSLETGGCIKFDLKAYDRALYQALTGGSNEAVFENFARAACRFRERPEPPLVVASTLLVPGYVDAAEVGRIARFIAELDPTIPYALLGFAPQFAMSDLPPTSLRHAEEAEREARRAGLRRVRIGNRHLLGWDY
jgi:pyruvate formate lyase activating enzyme